MSNSTQKRSLSKKQIACTGEIPLELIRMKAKGCEVKLFGNKPGFMLPSNIGELGDDITKLNLEACSLQGSCMPSSTQNDEALIVHR